MSSRASSRAPSQKVSSRAPTTPVSEQVCIGILNALLGQVGAPVVLEALSDCVPSLWVALIEGLFQARLEGIDRVSELSEASRLRNLKVVLDFLEENVLQVPLAHITPEGLLAKRTDDIMNLTEIVGEIAVALRRAESGEAMPKTEVEQSVDDYDANEPTHAEVYANEGATRVVTRSGEEIDEDDVGDVEEYGFSTDEVDFSTTVAVGSTTGANAARTRNTHAAATFSSLSERSHTRSGMISGVPRDDIEEFLERQSEALRREVDGEQTAVSQAHTLSADHHTPLLPSHSDGEAEGIKLPKAANDSTQVASSLRNRSGTNGSGEASSHDRRVSFSTPVTPAKSTKRRLNDSSQFNTPHALKPSSSDTPYTRMLKRRRKQLLREYDNQLENNRVLVKATRRPNTLADSPALARTHGSTASSATLSSTLHTQAQSFYTNNAASELKTSSEENSFEVPQIRLVNDMPSSSSEVATEGELSRGAPSKSAANTSSMTLRSMMPKELPAPEQNLRKLASAISETLPTARLSEGMSERMWKMQVADYVRALDAKRRAGITIDASRRSALAGEKQQRAVKATEKEMEREATVATQKKHAFELASVRYALRNRTRAVTRMEKRQEEIMAEIAKWEVRRKGRDEKLIKDIYESFLAEQRALILEEQRMHKESAKSAISRTVQKQERELLYYRDQVAMLQEQLREAREEERLVMQGQAETHRRVLREQKEQAKKAIELFKERLRADADNYDDFFRDLDTRGVLAHMNLRMRQRR